MAEREPEASGLSVIGRSLPKVDAAAKVTGQTVFADDLVLPRMAYAKLLRSPHPHARLRDVDPAEARVGMRRPCPASWPLSWGASCPSPSGSCP